ncbi:hypothetical protein ACJMK2_014228 [Sinanodonta woodiana]|uniref:Peroxidase n=1 Tax=Sinanodonta woodiana TaxID=1069815 RepID=A0ABD3V189_SINWO
MTSLYLECLLLVGLTICAVQSQIPSSNIADAVHVAGVKLGVKRDRNRQRFEDGKDRLSGVRPQDRLQQFHGRQPKSSDISSIANQVLDVTQQLLHVGFTIDNVTSDSTVVAVQDALMFMGVCDLPTIYKCDPLSPYRTIDGSCNNLDNPEWGKSNVAQRRDLGPVYESGTIGDPRITGVNGRPLPNPRTISNVVHSNINGITLNASISLHTFQMGQFLAHDIILTPTETGQYGATISCCGEFDRPECIPVEVPPKDPYYADGTCFNIVRSAAANPSCTPGFRQQQNQITSYIDGSNVYGSTDDELNALRDGEYLRKSRENNLPRNPDQGCEINHDGEFCHLAGDPRVDVVPSLASYHTLFMLEHNRIVDALKKVNPDWNVEKLFQEARKINIAQMQHIIYNGFMSAFLSRDTITTYKLRSLNTGYSTSYDKKRDATIANGFGIAYRMGHTWIPTYMDLYSDLSTRKSGPEMGPFDVVDTFNNPHLTFLNQRTGCPALLKWMTSQASPATDRVLEDSARNRLFEDSTGASFDLAALNILRGRDHGVPPYGDYRVSCGLSPLTATWDSLVDHKPREMSLLRQVYNDPRDIDLFTGLLTEKSISGSSMGPTLSCILGREFQNLKEGDSYWYERPEPQGFAKEQLNEIRKTSLSAVLCANLGLAQIQIDAFKLPASNNLAVPCTVVPSIDFTKWKSTLPSKPGIRQSSLPEIMRQLAKMDRKTKK